jgi:hypothetical protein
VNKGIVEFLYRKRKKQIESGKGDIAIKLRKGERLSSEEFWEIYKLLHVDGPTIKYQTPDGWNLAKERSPD